MEKNMTPNILTKLRKNPIIEYCLTLNQDLFLVMLVTYLLLILLEIIWDGFVSSYLNLNLNQLLTILIISGVIAVLTRKKEIVKDSMSIKRAFSKLKLILKINPIDFLNQKIRPKISNFFNKMQRSYLYYRQKHPRIQQTPKYRKKYKSKHINKISGKTHYKPLS
jgi:hypothetical protein